MSPEALLNALTGRYQELLGENFVGLYVHGSYAMGGFNPLKSDLDYIIVCGREPDAATKRCIMDATIAYMQFAPAKGLEMHLMLREDCLAYRHPPRFLLHYSPAHTRAYLSDPDGYVASMQGRDMDLAAHLTVMYARGQRVAGPEMRDVFGPVPKEAYIASILDDAGWSEADALYHVLNRCRTLAYVADGQVRSKKEGARWALENLPLRWHALIRETLACYEGGGTLGDMAGAESFCREALADIRAADGAVRRTFQKYLG